MMTYIEGNGINEVVYKAIDQLLLEGNRTPTRNGSAVSINNTMLSLKDPRCRHLQLFGRNNNIFATIAEIFWVYAGDDRIDPFLSFFLPRAKDFSDDGVTWRGGYGPRLYDNNQLDDVVECFVKEGIFTRRAVLNIYDHHLDSFSAMKEKGLEDTKDRPCNVFLDFFITPDKKLHMNAKSRSGDILWGVGSINIAEWTFIQEWVLSRVKDLVDPEVTLGSYNHLVTNLHMYDFSGKQGYDVIENKLKQRLGFDNNDGVSELVFPEGDSTVLKQFCTELLNIWSSSITNHETSLDFISEYIDAVFTKYGFLTENNLLHAYAEIVSAYIVTKNFGAEEVIPTISLDISGYGTEFKRSVLNSKFRKFELVV